MVLLQSAGAALTLGLFCQVGAHARRRGGGGHGLLDDHIVEVLQWAGLGLLAVFVLAGLWGVLTRPKPPTNAEAAKRRADRRAQRRVDRGR